VLVAAQNGGKCYQLQEYRECRIASLDLFDNQTIPNISVCINAGSDDFGTVIDLSPFANGVEIENFVLVYEQGQISCDRDQEWSFTKFGCQLCEPWPC
jgi:hypothetical protein